MMRHAPSEACSSVIVTFRSCVSGEPTLGVSVRRSVNRAFAVAPLTSISLI